MRTLWLIRFLAAMATLMLVTACVPSKPVVDYTPEQLATLQITLEGKGAIIPGVYRDDINDLIWTCHHETPVKLTVDVDGMKANLKLRIFGQYFRASTPVNKNGEAKASIGMVSYGAITKKYILNTEVQLRYQRGRITISKGTSPLGGCPTGWFDLLEKGHAVQGQKPKIINSDGRFIQYDTGVVLDTETGLEWYAGPDRHRWSQEAKRWVESLNVAGGGWRMPTMKELKTLYKKGAGLHNITPLLKTTGWRVWSGETKGLSSLWNFNYELGTSYEQWGSAPHYGYRAFAVRFKK